MSHDENIATAYSLIAAAAASPALTLPQVQVELGRGALLRIATEPDTVSLSHIADVLKGLEGNDGKANTELLAELKTFWTGPPELADKPSLFAGRNPIG
jgi:hypothetical protein